MNERWNRQRLLKDKDIPTPEEMFDKAKSISDPQVKVLFCLLYLTAGRLSEVVGDYAAFIWKRKCVDIIDGKKKYQYFRTEIKRDAFEGLKKRNFEEVYISDRPFLAITLRNLKNRRTHKKTIPIPLDKPIEKDMAEIVMMYLSTINIEQDLFSFKRGKAFELLENEIKEYNPHFIRHVRLTHLIKNKDFDDYSLIKFAGWTDSRSGVRYIELRIKDLANKM